MSKRFSYFLKTYGCQANIRDGEAISGVLRQCGYIKSDDINKADIVILNTCAVRENAEKKVFGEIGFLQKLRKHNKNFLLGVGGCMPHEENIQSKLSNTNQIDFVFGTKNIDQLPKIIKDVIKHRRPIVNVCESKKLVDDLVSQRNSKIKAFVNVMYGCNKFCSYCIVPFTRGRIKSRNKQDIIDEINTLIKQGYKEVTLLGQNVNSYGIDFKNNKYNFANLLEDVAKTNIARVRFCTSNPWNFSKEIIDVMAKHKNIMPYVHLPIQSGSEEILKEMNRTMKIKDYIDFVNYLRKKIPNCAISTDIIVGFPNESEKQFNQTLTLVKKIKFDNIFAFVYSKRPNTKAALIKDRIDLKTKQDRLAKLNELVKKYAKENNQKYLNKIISVLVEGKSKTNINTYSGYSPEWKVVNFIGNAKVGEIVRVKITKISRFSLFGISAD